jgi:O-antigen/teichoic acid export membrane protein
VTGGATTRAEPAIGGRRITLDVAVQLGGRGLNVALGIAVTIVVVRALGDERFGQWATLLAATTLTTYFGNLGLQQVAVSRAAAEPERAALWLGALTTLRTVLSLPVMIATALVLVLLSTDTEMRVAALILSAQALLAGPGSMRAIFESSMRNHVVVAAELIQGVVWALAVFLLAALGGGIVAFAVGFVCANVAAVVFQVTAALRAGSFRFGLRGARELWGPLVRLGLPVGISGLLIVAYARIDQVLVFQLAGDRAAGLYGSAYRLLERAEMLPAAVMTTLFPLLSAAWPADATRVRRLFGLALHYLTLGAIPVLAYVIVVAEPLVRALFGAEFAAAAGALRVLMLAFVLVAASYACGYTTIVLDLRRRFLRYALAALVFNVAFNVALIPVYGYMAAAWATVLTELLVLTLTLRAIAGVIGMPVLLAPLARTLLAGTAMTALLWALREAGWDLVGLTLAAAVLAPALLLATRATTPAEIRRLVAREVA